MITNNYDYIDFPINIASYIGIGSFSNKNINIVKSRTPKYALQDGFTIFTYNTTGSSIKDFGYSKYFCLYVIERKINSFYQDRSYINRKFIMKIYRYIEDISKSKKSEWCFEYNGQISDKNQKLLDKASSFIIDYAENFKV